MMRKSVKVSRLSELFFGSCLFGLGSSVAPPRPRPSLRLVWSWIVSCPLRSIITSVPANICNAPASERMVVGGVFWLGDRSIMGRLGEPSEDIATGAGGEGF